MRLGDRLVIQQPVGLLDRAQRPLGILGHSREHPLTLSLDPPATIRLFGGLRVVELKTIDQRPAGLLVDRRDRVDQLLDPVANEPDRVLRRGRAQHRRRVNDLLACASNIPNSSARRNVFSSARRSLPCNNNRARYFVNDVGCQPR